MLRRMLIVLIAAAACASYAMAEPLDELKKRFPADFYLIGFAEVKASGDSYKDRRRVEVLSRLDIARKIKITTKSRTVDATCEQHGNEFFGNKIECINMITEIVEESVDEVLEGSEIVEVGENKAKGTFYAVATLPKKKAGEKADDGSRESLEKAKQHLDNAKTAPDEAKKKEEIKKAKAEVAKGMAYASEKSAIEDVRERGNNMFGDLSEEIKKLEGAQSRTADMPEKY